MLNVRSGVFETNSSSTHSICISKQGIDTSKLNGKKIHFYLGEYGWNRESVDPASYLYTAIQCLDADDLLEKVKALLDRFGVQYSFEEPKKRGSVWNDGYYIDHCDELESFLKKLTNDEGMLLRYLFGDTYVYTGNDNDFDDDLMGSGLARKQIWDSEKHDYVQNPYQNPAKYDYYYKGD